jgi:flagellar hook-length control protein FliK
MLAQSAIHETAGPGSAAAQSLGAKSKKKPQLLAGLFADLLSQARGSSAPGRLDSSKAGRLPTGKDDAGTAKAAHVQKKPASPHGQALSAADANRLKTNTDGKHVAEEQQLRKKAEKKVPGQPDELAFGEAPASGNAPEARRLRTVKEAAVSEAGAMDDRRVPVRSGPAAGASAAQKPKGVEDEAESAVERKKKDKEKQDSKLTVLDLRRSAESRREESAKAAAEPKADDAKDASKDSVGEAKGGSRGSELVRDLGFEPRLDGGDRQYGKSDSASAARGQDFQSALAERMREAWNGEIVKSAHIVLRDGDAGTIRLRLRPESLGNVKVELNLTDNNISGRILVESDEAKTAFERNMSQLADAFRQGGFDSARLEVAVGGGSQQGSSGAGSGESGGPFYSERLKSAVGSSADPATAGAAYARRGGAVDILA